MDVPLVDGVQVCRLFVRGVLGGRAVNVVGVGDSPLSPPNDGIVLDPLVSLDLGGETNLLKFGRDGTDILLACFACGLLAKGRRPEDAAE